MLHDYVLTMPKVKAYETATENAMAAGKSDPSLKVEGDKISTRTAMIEAARAKVWQDHRRFGHEIRDLVA